MEPKFQQEDQDKMFEHGESSGASLESKGKELVLEMYVRRHHALEKKIRDQIEGVMTRNKLKGTCLLNEFELRSTKDALIDESWIEAMHEEIKQIDKNKTWTLVPRPKYKNIIGTNGFLETS